jgi:hypothetical protein
MFEALFKATVVLWAESSTCLVWSCFWIGVSIFLGPLCHQVLGLTENKATLPVAIFGVQPYVINRFYDVVRASCGFIWDGGPAEIIVMPCFTLCTAE